jgi:putative DNA primase/helicase
MAIRLASTLSSMKTSRIRCPVHGGGNANVALWRDERNRLHAKCWSYGCDPRAILAALGETAGDIAGASYDPERSATGARKIWEVSRDARRTLVQRYLRSRGISIEPPASLHFHPALKHPNGPHLPAMVACVEDRDGRFLGIHRTWLTPAGSKTRLDPAKAALGPIGGGAVRLAPILSEKIMLAEGIETALSVMQATGIPTWAALGTSNLAQIGLADCVREVVIAADGDAAGEAAAQLAAQRFLREGRRVLVARPDRDGNDFNDYLTI